MSSHKENAFSDVPDDGVRFEMELRNRSLGRGPADRDQIMYQCGYAAGLASAAKQPARTIAQWRLIGAVASVLAVASLASHLVSVPTIVPSKPVAEVTERTSDTASQLTSSVWLTALTRGPTKNAKTRDAMTTVRTFNSESTSVNEGSFSMDWLDANHSVLQPRDFTNFLNGDA